MGSVSEANPFQSEQVVVDHLVHHDNELQTAMVLLLIP